MKFYERYVWLRTIHVEIIAALSDEIYTLFLVLFSRHYDWIDTRVYAAETTFTITE